MPLRTRSLNERLVFCQPTTYTEAYGSRALMEKGLLPTVESPLSPPPCVTTDWLAKKKTQPHSLASDKTKQFVNLIEYKKHVRFDLMWKAKEIIRTNPNEIQKPFILEKVDKQKEQVRRSRPRVVMPPAVSLDDIQDDAREAILADMYTPTSLKAAREVHPTQEAAAVTAPLSGHLTTYSPVQCNILLPKLKPHRISDEWRWESSYWDSRQMRGHCDVDMEFWTRRNVNLRSTRKKTQGEK